MKSVNGKYAWLVKIGEKGQFVIPKEAREMLGIEPGMDILVLGDKQKGIAIVPKEKQNKMLEHIIKQSGSFED